MSIFSRIVSISAFFCVLLVGQELDVSGYKLVQTAATGTYTIPNGTKVSPGGYIIIARNVSKAAFETFWGVTLPSTTVFLNTADASGAAPKINGSETYAWQNASSITQDGPSVALPATLVGRTVYQRKTIASPAGDLASWNVGTVSSPGSGMINTNSGKMIISEIADDAGTGNFSNEFVEIYYDVTPPVTGAGSVKVSPSRWKYNAPTVLQFTVKTQSDTVKGIRFRKPATFTWAPANISVLPNTAAVTSLNDTVTIDNISLAGTDSVVITIGNVTAADSTNEFAFGFHSSNNATDYLPMQVQPATVVYGSPRPMAQVKRKEMNGIHSLLGKWAVVKGIVTVANEFGGPSYLQDNSAAIAIFDSSVSNHIERGDEVVLLGLVAPFNELFEFTPCILLEKVSEGNPVDTLVKTISQALAQGSAEPDEGRLIRINDITSVTTIAGAPATTWATTGSGTNYKIIDPTGTMEIRISSRTNIANTPTPVGTFDVVGVLGQFLANYQLLPRLTNDIIPEGNGPRFTSAPPYLSLIHI